MNKIKVTKFSSVDAARLQECISERSGDKMYKLADKLQIGNLLNATFVLESVLESLSDLVIDGDNSLAIRAAINDTTKLIASVTTSLDKLVLSAATRPVEKTIDPLITMLNKVDFSKHCPPELRKEYLLSHEDQDRTDGKISTLITGEQKNEVVKELVEPITAYKEKEVEDTEDNVITFSKGLREL